MKNKWTPYALLVPQIILGLIFMIGLGTGITQSFGVIPAFGLTEPTFDYYKEILHRADLLGSLGYSLYISFVSAFLATFFGVLFCVLLISQKKKNGMTMRIVQLPIIVPHVVVALFIVNIFSQNGMLARMCAAFGWIHEQQEFPMLIYDTHGVGIILAYVWKELPFILYFVFALMSNINERLGEAAVNLGATSLQAFLRVTLPLCMNTILSGFLIVFVFALGAYEIPLLLGATLPKALPIYAYIEYSKPELLARPYAMAINGIIIAISFLAALIYYILIHKSSKNLTDTRNA